MRLRFNPPPNWPPVPPGWSPPSGWSPDPDLPALPPGWQLWVEDERGTATTAIAHEPVVLPVEVPAADVVPEPVIAAPQPAPGPQRRLAGLITFFVLAALAGLVAGAVWTLLKDAAPASVSLPDSDPVPAPQEPARPGGGTTTGAAGATTSATGAGAGAEGPLADWALLIRPPVIDLLTASQLFTNAREARDPAALTAACTSIRRDVAGAQAAGPAPDLSIATAFNQALGLYAQAASSCLQGADSLDDAQLAAADRSIRAATSHVTTVSDQLRQRLR